MGQVLEQGTLDQQHTCWKERMHRHLDFPTCKCSSVAQNQGVAMFGNQVHMDFASGKSVSRASGTEWRFRDQDPQAYDGRKTGKNKDGLPSARGWAQTLPITGRTQPWEKENAG